MKEIMNWIILEIWDKDKFIYSGWVDKFEVVNHYDTFVNRKTYMAEHHIYGTEYTYTLPVYLGSSLKMGKKYNLILYSTEANDNKPRESMLVTFIDESPLGSAVYQYTFAKAMKPS